MENIFLILLFVLAGCVAGKNPALAKYENAVAEADARAARGEIAGLEAENIKLAASQEYDDFRRRQEKQFSEDSARLIRNQNQDINAASHQFQ